MHYSGPQIISSCPNNTVTGGNMYSSGSTHCCAMRSGQGSNMNSKSKDDIYQSRVICLHAFSDLTHVSPAMFVYLLRECYICGTKKATFKFRVLQQQVLNALRNSPQPEPAVFIVQCLYILPLLGYPYTEGFSHLLISSYRRLQTKDNLSNSFESKRIASQLFLNILNHLVPHEERILIKLMEAFDLKLKEIAEVICGSSEVNDGHIDSAKTYLGHYIYKFIESQSYMTAVTLLEHFSICESVDSSLSFLDKLIQANQFKVAEKWAILMGKPMIRLLIKKYVEMNKPKNAYDMIKANNLKQEFSDVCQLYEQSSLKKLEDIVLHESPESSHSFLDRMIQNKQYKAAEKWAILMGKPMICLLIKRYVDMSMLKHAYLIIKANDLHEEFADVQHLYKQCLLKKLAEKGCWDVAEFKTNKDRQLLDYLVYLALEAGYHEKVEELCDRYSLSGFDNSIETDSSVTNSTYLTLNEFNVDNILWVDEIDGLLSATNYIKGCKVIGVDCEWKPNYVKGSKPNKVSIMQIASDKSVLIFDLIKLYNDEPKTLDSCFKSIMHSPKILKLGYNLQCDLRELSRSYGDLEGFRYYEMVLDIQKLFKEASGGLSGLAEKILGAGLNKTRRNSNWEQRPLTQNQIEYAALDATVLIHIFHHVHGQSQTTGMKQENSNEWKSHIVFHTGSKQSKTLKNM